MNHYTPIAVGAAHVALISSGDRIVGSLKDRGPFEPDSLLWWAGVCQPGATVIDVGAYTGLYTIGARLLGARCVSFEPMPFNRLRAKANCELNGVSDKISSEAVSDRCGTADMNYSPIRFTSGASLVGARTSKGRWLKVDTLTIDSLGLTKVAAIKIDVERADALVIAGARETLARCKPAILVEALGPDLEAAALTAAGDGYYLAATLDHRNRVLLPIA